MRRLLFSIGMFLAGSQARALEPATVTIDSVSSTMTIRGIDISSAPATSVVISTSPLYRQVCVQNFDISSFLACSELLLVSTLTASNQVGTIIPAAGSATTPAAPTCFSVVAGNNFYCRSSSVTGTTRAGIARGR